jgi:hypothetical protein
MGTVASPSSAHHTPSPKSRGDKRPATGHHLAVVILKALAVLVAAIVVGLLFAIVPCYLFVELGASERTWCGNRSTPPYFFVQLLVGAVVGAVGTAAALFVAGGKRRA